ncbi:hypothetical protein [Embleya sp. NPDC001921]
MHGTEADTAALREEVADVLEPLGLRLSQAKTRVVHMGEGFDFLGFRIRWKRKGGTDKWHVYTFVAEPAHPVFEGEGPCSEQAGRRNRILPPC